MGTPRAAQNWLRKSTWKLRAQNYSVGTQDIVFSFGQQTEPQEIHTPGVHAESSPSPFSRHAWVRSSLWANCLSLKWQHWCTGDCSHFLWPYTFPRLQQGQIPQAESDLSRGCLTAAEGNQSHCFLCLPSKENYGSHLIFFFFGCKQLVLTSCHYFKRKLWTPVGVVSNLSCPVYDWYQVVMC